MTTDSEAEDTGAVAILDASVAHTEPPLRQLAVVALEHVRERLAVLRALECEESVMPDVPPGEPGPSVPWEDQ